jgi:cytochrome c nitrite reductase small subunit
MCVGQGRLGEKVKGRAKFLGIGAAVFVVVAGLAGFGLWKYHEQPEFCATCHIMQPYLESWQSSDWMAHAHAKEDVACLDCHEATIQQQVNELFLFVTQQYETPLRERRFETEKCLSCHEHGSYEELIARTADKDRNPHDSHWGEMDCRMCHKAHRDSVDYCSSCHAPVTDSPGWVPATAQ